MSTIVTRAGKGSALTHTEVDANFTNLNTDKLQSGDTAATLTITSADINGGTIDGTSIGSSSASTGAFTTLNTSGNVGIGTSSPNSRLQVYNNINGTPFSWGNAARTGYLYQDASGVGITNAAGTSFDEGMYLDTANSNVLLYTNSTVRATLNSSGNLGLGVTPSAWSGVSNAGVIQTYSGAISTTPGGGFDTTTYVTNAFYNGTNWIYRNTSSSSRYDQWGNQHRFFVAPPGTAGNAITFTQAMTLDGSGRLLVGTTASRAFGAFGQGNFQIETAVSSALETLISNRNDTGASVFGFGKSRGTAVASNTVVVSGDPLGTINWSGADGTGLISAASIAAAVDGTPGTNDMPGRLVFSTTADGASSPTERMRIDSTGTLVLAATNSNGIQFPATQIANANANTLDDYEEGTFTPTVSGTTVSGAGTYSIQVGRYTKVGNRVFFMVNLTWSAHTGTGNMFLGGLPFTSANVSNATPSLSVWISNLALTASNVFAAYVNSNATTINVNQLPVGGGAAAAIAMDTAAQIIISGHYEV